MTRCHLSKASVGSLEALSGRPQSTYQSRIEHNESDKWSGGAEDQEAQSLVNHVVDATVPERCAHGDHFHLAGTDVLVCDCFHLEEHWKVVDERAGDHR